MNNIINIVNDYMRESIALAAVKLRLRVEYAPDAVDDKLIADVSRLYLAQYGDLPVTWANYIRTKSVTTKFIMGLIEEGYDPNLLSCMSLSELRYLYDIECAA